MAYENDENQAMARGEPEVEAARKAHVAQWLDRIRHAEKYHEKAFDRMREDMDLAYMGANGEWVAAGNYTSNIIQRQINVSVAALYAKNPRALAKRRQRLEFKLWDGKVETLMASQQMAAVGDPNAMALMMEVAEVQNRVNMLDRIGKTVECLFHYFLDEQQPRFKLLAKQAVRRAKVTGVAYVKLGFQRILEARPEVSAQINDVSNQIAALERMLADLADGEIADDAPDMEQLRVQLAALQEQEMLIAREGPVFTFPRSTAIVPDPAVRQLNGFVGARWVAEKFLFKNDEVKDLYKVDLGKNYSEHKPEDLSKFERYFESVDTKEGGAPRGFCAVYEVYDKLSGTTFTMADGYPDYLVEPKRPDVPIERFWPYFTLTFNDPEHESEVFPISDVRLMRDPQEEYNRSRQGLREQRRANRPKYAARRGALDEADIDQLKSHPSNAILQLNGLVPGDDVNKLIQRFQPVPIDPALYDVNPAFEDVLRVVGTSESAAFGAAGSETATGEAIAESSRMSTQSSNVDDLDEMLTDIARATGQLMLMELSAETAVEIAGPGAVWPELSREEIAKEVHLEVKAGSSGRPNRAAELANLERAAPWLVQIPGVSPSWMGRYAVERLDDGIDLEEAIVEGLPSIQAMNTASGRPAQEGGGDPRTDPGQQGGEGAQNAPNPQTNEPGGQPAFPQQGGIAPQAP